MLPQNMQVVTQQPLDPQAEVQVAGEKVLVIDGKTIMRVEDVRQRIAQVTAQVNSVLPAQRTALSADVLLLNAQTAIDKQIANATAALAVLTEAAALMAPAVDPVVPVGPVKLA